MNMADTIHSVTDEDLASVTTEDLAEFKRRVQPFVDELYACMEVHAERGVKVADFAGALALVAADMADCGKLRRAGFVARVQEAEVCRPQKVEKDVPCVLMCRACRSE